MSVAIGDFICGIQQTVAEGFRSLPAILGAMLLILSATEANYNVLFFFFGFWIFTPLITLLLNGLLELFFSWAKFDQVFWAPEFSGSATCSIFTTKLGEISNPISTVPSFWLSMMIFFFTYLFMNALQLYERDPAQGSNDVQVKARKFKAATSMAILILVTIMIIWLRYSLTACETALGVGVSAICGIGAGYTWFTFMSRCGLGRLEDVFGVAASIVPVRMDPIACVNNEL
jgi:4-hydroxybenzoate polyprenyltransferase